MAWRILVQVRGINQGLNPWAGEHVGPIGDFSPGWCLYPPFPEFDLLRASSAADQTPTFSLPGPRSFDPRSTNDELI